VQGTNGSARFDPPANLDRFREGSHPALYYQSMLADTVRMERYRAAIEEVVRPGDVVADLGTGLGILALMAARAGAARVYAIDVRPGVLWLAEQIVAANGLTDRVELIEADVRTVGIPEPVDLIVNELIGSFGTDEGIVEGVGAFAAKHLKRGGRVLPERLRNYLVPVEYDRELRGVFREDYEGLDLRVANSFPCAPAPVLKQVGRRARELAEPLLLEDVRFGREMPERELRHPFDLEIATEGTLQGFLGYFDATLHGEIAIRSYPAYPDCHWETWNWPVSPALPLTVGQRVQGELQMKLEPMPLGWTLRWGTTDRGGAPVESD
jgi:SAM-dependent methyltransferase